MDRRNFISLGVSSCAMAPWSALFARTFAAGAKHPSAGLRLAPWRKGHFQIHFIYTGVTESTFLIYPDGTSLLIDCGDIPAHKRGKYAVPILPGLERHAGEWIARYILRVNPHREKVDYMLLTHYHSDHGGGRLSHAGLAPNGEYYLSGFGQAMEWLSFGKAIDRAWPTFDDPLPRRPEDDSWMLEHIRGVYRELERRGTVVERFQLKKGFDQIRPVHGDAGDFGIRPLCANGRILMPDGTVRDLYADFIARTGTRSVNENAMSIGMKFTYGPFGFYTAGDFEDLQRQSDGSVWEIEEAMAETVGQATVAKVDHHGNKSMCGKLVSALRSQVYVGCVWDWFHVDDATMTRLADRSLYGGERLLCPGILTKERRVRDAERAWLKDVPAACFEGAHVVVDVDPSGKKFSVSLVSAADESMRVAACFNMRTQT